MIKCNNCFEDYSDEFEICPHCGYTEGDGPSEPYVMAPGTVLHGRYHIGKTLGVGGFAITYKAWDEKLDIVVAIKEYFQNGICIRKLGTPEVKLYAQKNRSVYEHGLLRFLDEARNLAKFNHEPNIVNVDEFFEENGTAYIVMEYLDGEELDEYFSNHDVTIEECIKIILCVADALKKIHAEGFIHRDVAPDNIMICKNGAVKLFDLGAGRFSEIEDQNLTIVLKPGYAPPEQYDSVDPQGPWTDVYGLGATSYFMLTGEKPEESTNRKIKDTLKSPSELNPNIPEYVSNTVMKAMAVEIHMRFQTIEEFEKGLNKEVKILSLAQERKHRRRRRNIGIGIAVSIVLIGAGVFAHYLNRQYEEETLPSAEITIWYSITGDEADDLAKRTAFNSIKNGFSESFPGVSIVPVEIEEREYIKAYLEAKDKNDLPNLFETTLINPDELSDSYDLSFLLNTEEVALSWFINDKSLLQNTRRIPLGFYLPTVFVNHTIATNDLLSIESPEQFIEILPSSGNDGFYRFAVSEEMRPVYESVFGGGFFSANDFVGRDDFLNGNVLYFLGSTMDYSIVQSKLPARYDMLPVIGENSYAILGDYWSMSDSGNKDEDKVAKRFIQYLLSESSQDYLHLRNISHYLPLNKHALEEYAAVYYEYGSFIDNIDRLKVYNP